MWYYLDYILLEKNFTVCWIWQNNGSQHAYIQKQMQQNVLKQLTSAPNQLKNSPTCKIMGSVQQDRPQNIKMHLPDLFSGSGQNYLTGAVSKVTNHHQLQKNDQCTMPDQNRQTDTWPLNKSVTATESKMAHVITWSCRALFQSPKLQKPATTKDQQSYHQVPKWFKTMASPDRAIQRAFSKSIVGALTSEFTEFTQNARVKESQRSE